jgi:hypothetical protein
MIVIVYADKHHHQIFKRNTKGQFIVVMQTQRLDDNFVIHRDARLVVIMSSKYHHTSHFVPKVLSGERHNVFWFGIHCQAQHIRSCVVSRRTQTSLEHFLHGLQNISQSF